MAKHKQGDGKGETLDVANCNKNEQYVDCWPEYASITVHPWQNTSCQAPPFSFPSREDRVRQRRIIRGVDQIKVSELAGSMKDFRQVPHARQKFLP